jgi:hypothetical protein
MEAYTYHLVASHGMDVIIIPELDCRLVVIEKHDYSPQEVDLVIFRSYRSAFARVSGDPLQI